MGTEHLAILVQSTNDRAELRDVCCGEPVNEGKESAEIGDEGVSREEHVGDLLSRLPLPHTIFT